MLKEINMFILAFALPVIGLADQQYMTADSTAAPQNTYQTQSAMQPSQSMPSPPQVSSNQIYVSPPTLQQPQTNNQLAQNNNNPNPPSQPAANSQMPTQNNMAFDPNTGQPIMQNRQNLNSSTSAQSSSVIPGNNNMTAQTQASTQPPPMANQNNQNLTQPSNQATLANAYTDDDRKAWLNSCVSAISDNRVSDFSEEFCECGWQKIITGAISPQLLSSTNPNDVRQKDMLLVGITQQCMVQLMSEHKLG